MIKDTLTYICARLWYFFHSLFNKSEVISFLISERGIDARDNGYHLLKWMVENHPEIDVTYVISSDSPDYDKVKDLCKTVEYRSWQHYKLFVSSKVLISTHIMGYSPNAYLFRRWGGIFPNIIYPKRQKRVFLQHGVMNVGFEELKADRNHLDLFVCTTTNEYNFLRNEYGWSEEVLKQLGLARYDVLKEPREVKKQILIMPTWRRWLLDATNGEFQSSDYFKHYYSVLTNKELIKYFKEKGYKLVFYLHQEFQGYSPLFISKDIDRDVVEIATNNKYDVQTLLRESSLLITDHSSVFFDFAYQNKPVIYYQFDNERYYKEHAERGYFIFEIDGFGDVVTTTNELIASIKKTVNDRCELTSEYQDRITKCFDGRNEFTVYDKNLICEMTYNEIMEKVNE